MKKRNNEHKNKDNVLKDIKNKKKRDIRMNPL